MMDLQVWDLADLLFPESPKKEHDEDREFTIVPVPADSDKKMMRTDADSA